MEKAWLAGICREIPDAHIYRESGEMNGRSTLQVDETRLEERTGRMEGGVNDNVAAFPTPGGVLLVSLSRNEGTEGSDYFDCYSLVNHVTSL